MKVSIIITTRDKEEYLDLTLLSISKQTNQNFELIVCNDASSDHTNQVLLKWSSYFDLTIVQNITRLGAAASRNKAIKKCKYELILFLDDDRLLLPNAIDEHVLAHERRNNCFVCGTRWELYSGLNSESRESLRKIVTEGGLTRFRKHIEPLPRIVSLLYRNRPENWSLVWLLILTGNLSVSRSIINKLGGFNEGLERLEDLELGYRAFKHGYTVEVLDSVESFHIAHIRNDYKEAFINVCNQLSEMYPVEEITSLRSLLEGKLCLPNYERIVLMTQSTMSCECNGDSTLCNKLRIKYFN